MGRGVGRGKICLIRIRSYIDFTPHYELNFNNIISKFFLCYFIHIPVLQHISFMISGTSGTCIERLNLRIKVFLLHHDVIRLLLTSINLIVS